ncbi:hypothetical protein SeMB42_g00770 [Synchytrium endobioticum]|uniref:Uncharacterized protein n=1 Tax=Synchytrium endobioticum TaxID=286115 RepID=A0A507DPE5_9FUNG|nr:hypothetical protein SeLEV6574_g06079 [Synchytrium endobioticum]TPX53473.1 hypothetical protein SeMB42_g00770 [Synchytrium endobioticum]
MDRRSVNGPFRLFNISYKPTPWWYAIPHLVPFAESFHSETFQPVQTTRANTLLTSEPSNTSRKSSSQSTEAKPDTRSAIDGYNAKRDLNQLLKNLDARCDGSC